MSASSSSSPRRSRRWPGRSRRSSSTPRRRRWSSSSIASTNGGAAGRATSPPTAWSRASSTAGGPSSSAEAVAQLALEDLAAHVLRQLVHEQHLLRGLEAGQAVAAQGHDLLVGGAGAFAQRHDGGDPLAPGLVGQPDDG